MSSGRVQAAGGVVWKVEDGDLQVLLVHRPKYDDWTFPKGKLDEGETHEEAARREVDEETGFHCKLGPELEPVAYRDNHGRPKTVRYWTMTISKGSFAVNDEVDSLVWATPHDAVHLLSYAHDLPVLASFTAYAKAARLKHHAG